MNEKLTAYALNELPPDERAALEAQMKNDPKLREEVEEMKSFCEMLDREIHAGADDTLKPEQRTRLVQTFQSTSPERNVIRPLWRKPAVLSGLGLAAAACVALMFSLHEAKVGKSGGKDGFAYNYSDDGVKSEMRTVKKEAPRPSESVQVHPAAPTPLPKRKDVDIQDETDRVGAMTDSNVIIARNPAPLVPQALAEQLPPPPPSIPPLLTGTSHLGRNGTMTLSDDQSKLSVAKDVRVDQIAPIAQIASAPKDSVGATAFSGGSNTYAGVTTANGGTLTKTGGGVLTLTGDSTFTGGMSVNNGSVTIPGTVAGSGGVNLTRDGNLTLNGANTYTGSTTISAGTLTITGGLAGNPVATGATGATGGGATPPGQNEFSGAYAVNGAGVVSAPSSGATIITKSGNGTINLGNATLDVKVYDAYQSRLTATAGAGVITMGGSTIRTPVPPASVDELIAGTPSGKLSTDSGVAGKPALALNSNGGALTLNGTLGTGTSTAAPGQAPGAAPELAKNVEDANRHIQKAESYTKLGDYDNAETELKEALHLDPYGTASRRGLEKVEQEKSHYFEAARDQQRTKMLNVVNAGWEDQVPIKFDTGVPSTTAPTAPASPPLPFMGSVATAQSTPTFGLGVETKSTSTFGELNYTNTEWTTFSGVSSGVSVKPDPAQATLGRLPAPSLNTSPYGATTQFGIAMADASSGAPIYSGGTIIIGGAAAPALPAAVAATPAQGLTFSADTLQVNNSSNTTVAGVIGGTLTPQTPAILAAGTSTPSTGAGSSPIVTAASNTPVELKQLAGSTPAAKSAKKADFSFDFGTAGESAAKKPPTKPSPSTATTADPVVASTLAPDATPSPFATKGQADQLDISDPSGHASLLAQKDSVKKQKAAAVPDAPVRALADTDVDFDDYKKILDQTAELKKEAEALPENTDERTAKDNELRGKYRELRAYENKLNEHRLMAEHRRQLAMEQERLRLLQREADERTRLEAEERARQQQAGSTATYRPIVENPFTFVARQPLSTFSTDVDTASYSNVRRFLNSGQRPPADAVRLEEMINYFPYSYAPPQDDKPFAVKVDMSEAPWQPLHRLARIAIKAREVKGEERQAANFTFLLDVSGSMSPPERLPLVKQALRLLVEQLREDDRVSIVTYAGESGLALDSTPGDQKEKILEAINSLHANGSTNGAGGIRMAYEQAVVHYKKGGINRVILCTDGDFNVGTSNVQELERLIADKAKTGVFLSVLGVGTDNLHDHTMQTLADRGNGNYHYLDSMSEARKVLVEQMTGTLVTVAKDVKIQIEFNPSQVAAYRLIGYEKRMMVKEDFNNDKKDAGDIGAGHTITALYEIVPASLKYPDGNPVVDELKYAKPAEVAAAPAAPEAPATAAAPKLETRTAGNKESMTVKLRYKEPNEDKSKLIQIPVTDKQKNLGDNDHDFQFAVSVAGFGMMLRNSPYGSELSWDSVREMALAGKGKDEQGWRGEFIQLIEKARGICGDPR